jgi:2-oxoisovalerate dehydrogenase E1 component beta subunit
MEIIEQAAEKAEEAGVSCEIIDLRSILPWDVETIAKSVVKTGRLIISHEAPITNGFGAEIAATIQEACFLHLESPIMRVCGLDTPYPLALEKEYVPDALKVFAAIKKSVEF